MYCEFNRQQMVYALDKIRRLFGLVLLSGLLLGAYVSHPKIVYASNSVGIGVQQDSADMGDDLDEDGWLKFSFPGVEGYLDGMKAVNGDLYVWGIKKVGGIEVDGIAKLDDETGIWSNIHFVNTPRIYDLDSHNNQLYVAGSINLDGINYGVAIYDAGALTPLGGAFNGVVVDIEWHQGSLYAIGEFTDIGGVMANRIARWNGSAWEALGSGLLGFGPIVRVVALASVGDTLYVGGQFGLAGGVQVKNLAAWQNNQWRKSVDFEGEVRLLATDGTSLYVDRQQGGLVRVQNEQVFSLGSGLPPGVLVYSILPAHGGVYVAADSYFRATNGNDSTSSLSNVAFFDGVNWHSMGEDFIGNFGRPSPPSKLTIWRNQLAAAGSFDRSGSKALPGLAMWDGAQWNSLPSNPGIIYSVDGPVLDIAVYAQNLYAVGRFKLAGQVTTSGVARWDGQNWYAVGDGTLGGLITAEQIAVDGRGVFVAGKHRFENGVEIWNIAFWNGATWQLIGDVLRGQLISFGVDGSTVYASGSFRPFESDHVYQIGQWDGTQWTFYPNNLFDGKRTTSIFKMEIVNNTVYGCGDFYNEQGEILLPVLARWNGSAWQSILPENLHPRCVFTVHQGGLYLTAEFVGQDPNGFPYRDPVLLRVVGDQWEVISSDPLLMGEPYVWTDAGELFAHAFGTLPPQFADSSWPPPTARIHWLPFGSSRALPVPRSDFGIGPVSAAVYYRGMLVIGGDFASAFTGEKTYMAAWQPLSADLVLSLNAPQEARTGERVSVSGSVTLAAGQNVPYVMAVLDDQSALLNTEVETSDNCKKLIGNNSGPFNPWRNQGMECAWRRLKEGEQRDYHFTVASNQIGPLLVEMRGHWSGNELDRSNDSDHVWINIYGKWTVTPIEASNTFMFKDERMLGFVIPAGAVGSNFDLYLRSGRKAAPSPGGDLAMIQPMFELSLDSAQRQGDLVFAQPISATVGYTETDSYRVIESTLALYRYDDALQAWVPTHSDCAGASVSVPDPVLNTVVGSICRTGTYALMGKATPILYLPLTQKATHR